MISMNRIIRQKILDQSTTVPARKAGPKTDQVPKKSDIQDSAQLTDSSQVEPGGVKSEGKLPSPVTQATKTSAGPETETTAKTSDMQQMLDDIADPDGTTQVTVGANGLLTMEVKDNVSDAKIVSRAKFMKSLNSSGQEVFGIRVVVGAVGMALAAPALAVFPLAVVGLAFGEGLNNLIRKAPPKTSETRNKFDTQNSSQLTEAKGNASDAKAGGKAGFMKRLESMGRGAYAGLSPSGMGTVGQLSRLQESQTIDRNPEIIAADYAGMGGGALGMDYAASLKRDARMEKVQLLNQLGYPDPRQTPVNFFKSSKTS